MDYYPDINIMLL